MATDAVLILKDVYGGELIRVPGSIGSDGTLTLGLADRVPPANLALLVLLNPHGGIPFNVPVTIENDGRVALGNAPTGNPNQAIMVVNRTDGGQPLNLNVAIASDGALTIASATFENPAVAPTYDFSEIGLVDESTVSVRFSVPVSSADFTDGVVIKKNTASQTISSGTLQADGITVRYVLDTPVDANDTVTWEYAKSGGDIASTFDGTELENVSAQAVTNNIAGVPPEFDSAEVGAVLATTVVLTLTEDVSAAGNDYSTGVIIKVNSVSKTISSGTRQANHAVIYYVIPAVTNGQTVTIEYSAVSGLIVNEADGEPMATFAAQPVTNTVA